MTALPQGTVTFLFTDVEGSTRLLQQLGDAYAEVLAEHRRVLREVFARHGGVEVDTQGDAFFVAFARASDALSAAVDARDALSAGPVRVRELLPNRLGHRCILMPARSAWANDAPAVANAADWPAPGVPRR